MKTKTPLKNVFVVSLVSAIFVAAIAWGGFQETNRTLIAAGIAFVVVFVSITVLRWAQKDDPDVKPGQPRLK
jgi:hypothetical protein